MKLFLAALVICPLLARSAWSQTPPSQPLSQVGQFLGLTDSQVTAILQNNNDYNNFASQQQQQILNAQAQIVIATAEDPLDPITIGNLYAGIETTCRGLRDKASTSRQQNISVLTDAQKLKLNALNDAMNLAPTISEAELGNLLGSIGSPPAYFNTASTFTATYPGSYSGVSGCGLTGGFGGIFGAILPPSLPSPAQFGVAGLSMTPALANRTVNKWFDRSDFVRIRESAIKSESLPQTKAQ